MGDMKKSRAVAKVRAKATKPKRKATKKRARRTRPRTYIPNPKGEGGYGAKALRFPDGHTVVESMGLFARQCGVAQTYVGKIMRGERQPSIHVFGRMAGVLGVSMEQLYAWLYGPKGMVPRDSHVWRRRSEREDAPAPALAEALATA